MRALSIKNRLSLWLILSVVVLFTLHWLVTSRAPVRFLETYVAGRLQHDAQGLLVGLQFQADGQISIAPRYLAGIYQRPFSGHYYEIRSADQRLRSRSLWDEELKLPASPINDAWQGRVQGPQHQSLFVWAKRYNKQGHSVLIAIAEDLSPIDTLIERFRWRFALVSLALLVVLILIMRVVVQWGLRPLRDAREELQQLEKGEITELTPPPVPEVRPLIEQINQLLQVLRQRLARSRNAVGNLAHALKTPLAYLTQLIDREDTALDQPTREEISQTVERIRHTLDRELSRARLAGQGVAGQRFDVAGELPNLIRVLERVHGARGIRFHCEVAPDTTYPADPQDMMELLGNLLDNAGKWARSAVWLSVLRDDGLQFIVEDDGEGVPGEQLSQLQQRGTRLDEQTPGHGLGLAIVEEIVQQYRGHIDLGVSSHGGLKVTVHLP
jgi:signal transduction histidine kinase